MKGAPYRVVIAGAGVAGLGIAALLARSDVAGKLQITVVDAQEAPAWNAADDVDLRVSALSAGSLALLERAGVAASIAAARSCPYRDMRVWDRGSDAFAPDALHFRASEFALPQLGAIVEDALTRDCLRSVVGEHGVELRSGAAIDGVTQDARGVTVALAGGEQLSADLLVGADGARSPVRAAVGIETEGHRYPQSAFVTHARCEREHRHTAWQRFLPTGPIALLPLADGRVSIVWSATPDTVAGLMDASDEDVSHRLTEASDAVLGRLQVAGPRGSFPLALRHARAYVARRVVLVGDAAHTVHPLAGQGANLGLADARALRDTLVAAIHADEYPGDLPVLRRYERARRGANATMMIFIDMLNRLFATEGSLAGEMRRGGMRLFNRSGPVKARAMRVALGL